MSQSHQVRVKRRGQVTIPSQIRLKFCLDEGTLLEVKDVEGSIVMKPIPRLEPGKAVGEEEYKRIIHELDQSRENWR